MSQERAGNFDILFEVVPELREKSFEELCKIWRDWMNDPAQADIMPWMRRPLSPEERHEIQVRFANDYAAEVAA